MSDQASVIGELYKRMDTLDPAHQAAVKELAARFKIGGTERDYWAPPPVTGQRMSAADAQKYVRPLPARATAEAPSVTKQIGEGVADFGKTIYNTVRHPIDTVAGIGPAQMSEARKIGQAGKAGRMSESLGHAVTAVTPVVGPMISKLADTLSGNPEMPPQQTMPEDGPLAPPQPWRAAAQGAATLVAPKVLGAAAEAIPNIPGAGAAGAAAKGAIVGGIKEGAKPIEYGMHKLPIPAAIAGAAAGRFAGHVMGPGGATVGTIVGGAAPIVRGAIKGGKEALGDYRATQRVGNARTPSWSGVPAASPEAPPPVEAILSQLPSGRTPGPMQPPPAPPPRVSLPEQAGISGGMPPPKPPVEPIQGTLPSGRKPGGIQNQQPQGPPEAPVVPTISLDDIAQSTAGKKFSRLNPQEQLVVKQIAQQANKSGPPTPPTAQPAAPKPVAQTIAPSGESVAKAPKEWPKHIVTEDGIRAQAADHGVPEVDARTAVVQNGYQIMGRADLNRLIHAIGQDMGLDHATLSDVAKQTYRVKSLSQLNQDQMLEMYHNLLGKQSAKDPTLPKTGDLRMHNGKPVRVTKIYQDGTADVEPE